MAEIGRNWEGGRGVRITDEGVQDNALEGRGLALIELGGGKCEGMPETAKIPLIKYDDSNASYGCVPSRVKHGAPRVVRPDLQE
jgi:hypothetical protein